MSEWQKTSAIANFYCCERVKQSQLFLYAFCYGNSSNFDLYALASFLSLYGRYLTMINFVWRILTSSEWGNQETEINRKALIQFLEVSLE